MSSVEDRQNRATVEQKTTGRTLQLPGLVDQLSPVEQLSFPQASQHSFGTRLLPESHYLYQSAQGITRPLSEPISSLGVTRSLPEVQTGAMASLRTTTTSLRQPVVIRSTNKKSTGTMRPPKGRSWVVQLSVTIVLLLMAVGTLLAVAPAGTSGEMGFNPFRPIINWAEDGNSNPSLLAQQAATATVVKQATSQPTNPSSGNSTGSYQNNPIPPAPPSGSNGYDGFSYGQCTYWADLRYHQLTNNWVPWGGDAWQWASGARAYGWNVSSSPHVPSIIVLQPGVQGAGGLGHVGVVERINPDGTVYVTNWNWFNNGGGWARWSWWDFTPGPGVSFVWR